MITEVFKSKTNDEAMKIANTHWIYHLKDKIVPINELFVYGRVISDRIILREIASKINTLNLNDYKQGVSPFNGFYTSKHQTVMDFLCYNIRTPNFYTLKLAY